jgi:hypothetical protein
MRLPSVKTIERLGCKCPTAVRRVMEDYRDDKTCNAGMALGRIDELIGGHGVEVLRSRQDTLREFHGLEYVNMGDAYALTVLFDYARGTFYVGCWGDWVERYTERFGEE